MKNLEKLMDLAQALPDGLKDGAIDLVERMGSVIEGIGDKPIEWRSEILKLVQGTSDRGKLPKGAAIGSFVLGEDLMETPMKVIPIRIWTSRQYWNPDPEQAQMLCNSPDGITGFQYGECRACEFSKFDTETNRSQCNKTLSVLNITADLKRIFVTNFSKSGYMSGIDWQGLIKKAGVAPYKRMYNMGSLTSTKSKNVELIKVEPILTGNRVEGAILAFVEEVFALCSEDRKVMLERFYEYAKNKKENATALEAPADVVLLAAADDEVVTAGAETVAESAAEDSVTDVVAKPGKSVKTDKYKL